MSEAIAIHWFRQDLRLGDNPALLQAAQQGRLAPIYILDDENAGEFAMGGASRCWLFHSLASLSNSLGGKLSLYRGDPLVILEDLLTRLDVAAVHWNRCYEPWRRQRDERIENALTARGARVSSSNGSLLWEPWRISNSSGGHYKVFTPFYRKGCLQAPPPRAPLAAPQLPQLLFDDQGSLSLQQLSLMPASPWGEQLTSSWKIGEQAAQQRLQQFIREGLGGYKDGRDYPARPFVSRLSPHLHFGEISPHQVWQAIRSMADDRHSDHFCSELGWREFACNLLHHHPDLPSRSLQEKFAAFPWREDEDLLNAWRRGVTGVPMVDAGMRELWRTGYMHNRLRMIVGSFLVKNLGLHWRHGERWFWDTLVDADLANNSAGWQWIAGCGADAAPFFRIFNPVAQGQKFDPDGAYVRRFVPELAALPDKHLFCPWQAPAHVLQEAGVELGRTYPLPVVDLKSSRQSALAAFHSLR